MLLGMLYYIIIVHNFIFIILHRYGSYNILSCKVSYFKQEYILNRYITNINYNKHKLENRMFNLLLLLLFYLKEI